MLVEFPEILFLTDVRCRGEADDLRERSICSVDRLDPVCVQRVGPEVEIAKNSGPLRGQGEMCFVWNDQPKVRWIETGQSTDTTKRLH